jgi:hypothetical protein
MTGAQHQERQRGRGQWLLPGLLAGLLALATRAGRLPPPTFADGITARACARQLAGLGTAQDAATALASAEHALERALAGPAAQQR